MRKWVSIGSAVAALFVAGNFFQPTVVVGESMAPTLRSGRVIWIDRLYYKNHVPQRGEVVVFRQNGHTYVKRVYRGPGEKVNYLTNDGDWIAPIREMREREFLARIEQRRNKPFDVKTITVPDDAVFVLGDNYLNSEDSRQLGPIPLSAIIGRAHLEAEIGPSLSWEATPAPASAAARSHRRIAKRN
jgi:signal peptidase I